jgi:hypothetical protein
MSRIKKVKVFFVCGYTSLLPPSFETAFDDWRAEHAADALRLHPEKMRISFLGNGKARLAFYPPPAGSFRRNFTFSNGVNFSLYLPTHF